MTNEWTPCSWTDVLDVVTRLGRNAFVASVDGSGSPHLAIVWIIVVDGVLHFVSDAGAAKVRNLSARPSVAVHWQVAEGGDEDGRQLFVRGRAEVVTDPAERHRLWHSGGWGDLGQWYQGPDDASMAFVRIEAARASIVDAFGSGPQRRWRAEPSAG